MNQEYMNNSVAGSSIMPAVENEQNDLYEPIPSNSGMIPRMTAENQRLINSYSAETPETLKNPAFLPAYLKQNLGRWMNVEFMLGNTLHQRTGQLLDVGANYIVLKTLQPSTTMVCDVHSIKFITIAHDADLKKLLS